MSNWFIIPESFIPYLERLEEALNKNIAARSYMSRDQLSDLIASANDGVEPSKIIDCLMDYYRINNVKIEEEGDEYRLFRHSSTIREYSTKKKSNYGRKSAWWFIPEDYLSCLKKLEDELNHKSICSKENLLKIINQNIAKPNGIVSEEILLWLERFYEEYDRDILAIDCSTNTYSLRKPTTLIHDYRAPYARTRIILEYFYEENKKGRKTQDFVSKMLLLAELHRYINRLNISLLRTNSVNEKRNKDNARANETSLTKVYGDTFNDVRDILLENGLIETGDISKTASGLNRDSYKFAYSGLIPYINSCSYSDCPEYDDKRRSELIREAIDILESKVYIKTPAGRIAHFKDKICNALRGVPVKNSDDRKLYHWLCTSLLLRLGYKQTAQIAKDLMNYMRFANTMGAWSESNSNDWNRFDPNVKIWETVAKSMGCNSVIPQSVTFDKFIKSANRLIDRINELLDEDKNSFDHRLYLSAAYIRATIASFIKHELYQTYLDNAYKYAVCNNYEHRDLDICLLSLKVVNSQDDTLLFNHKAKNILFVLSQQPFTPDRLKSYIDIYLSLISNTHEKVQRDSYIKKCGEYLDQYEATELEIDYDFLHSCFLYLGKTQGDISNSEFATRLIKLWSSAKALYLDSKDPSKQMFLADIFILACYAIDGYMCNLIDFGASLSFLACQMLIDIRNINGINTDAFMKSWTAVHLLELIYSFGKDIIGFDSSPLRKAIHDSKPDYLFDKDWMMEMCNCQKRFSEAIEYAQSFLPAKDTTDISNLDEIAESSSIRLLMIEPLYALGHYVRANEELDIVSKQLGAISELYNKNEISKDIQYVLDEYEEFMQALRIFPMAHRCARLQYILDLIESSGKTDEYADFGDKWRQYVHIYNWHKEHSSKEQLQEFESDSFDEKLNKIESEIGEFPYQDYPSLNDAYLDEIYKILAQRCYVQGSFILEFNGEDMQLLSEPENAQPHCDKLFEVYKLFFLLNENVFNILPIRDFATKDFNSCSHKQLEFYLCVCYTYSYSLFLTPDDKRSIAQLYLKISDNYKGDNPKIRIKTALTYCLLAELLIEGDMSDLQRAEQYLYAARQELSHDIGLVNTDLEAQEVFIHICFYLTEVYDHLDKGGAILCLWEQLGWLKNLPASLDLARLLANVSDAYVFYGKNNKQAKKLLESAIKTLEGLPLTEDTEHYISMYRQRLNWII